MRLSLNLPCILKPAEAVRNCQLLQVVLKLTVPWHSEANSAAACGSFLKSVGESYAG